MVISRDAVFDEKSMLQQNNSENVPASEESSKKVIEVELEQHAKDVEKAGSSSSRMRDPRQIKSNIKVQP